MTCIIWTGTISFRNVSGLRAHLIIPDCSFAGQKLTIRCKIEDLSGKSHHYLGFEDDFVAVLLPGEAAYLATEFLPEQRGVYYLKSLKVFSSYPVDLFLTCIEIDASTVMVAPKPLLVNLENLSVDSSSWAEKQQSGKEGDYWMQLPYQEGEDASQINWAISARSPHEWVVIRSLRYGISRRLYFDFTNLSGEDFENSLKMVAGLIWQLKQKGVEAFVWGEVFDKKYTWLSVNKDLPLLVNWLAGIRSGAIPIPVDDGSEPVQLRDFIKDCK